MLRSQPEHTNAEREGKNDLSETRVHEALSVPCSGCGAALPLSPTLPSVWCPMCQRWNAVPEAIRAEALAQNRAVVDAFAERAEQELLARGERRQATWKRAQTHFFTVILALFVLGGMLTMAAIFVAVGAGVVSSLLDDYETWAVALAVGAFALLALIALVGSIAALYALYRAIKARRRRRRHGLPRWSGMEPAQSAAAICGVCGAPISFRVGESAVTCGFCRSVVVAAPPDARRLIALALGEAQRARQIHAKAERDKLRADLGLRRQKAIYSAYMYVGMLSLFALPLFAVLYAWRMLTPSVEEAMMALGDELAGDYGAGLDPAFTWLDAYWLGATPDALRHTGTFQSRWSIETVFHDRPVLITTTTSWTDRVASDFAVLLARPSDRTDRVLASAAADRIRGLGLEPRADYAGVCARGSGLKTKDVNAGLVTAVTRALYELAEAGRAPR
jgi:uncharacterized CHY-type Zn-finger protein